MILFNLICQNQHVFEAWFSNSKEFNNQKRKKMIVCPYCENNEIKKYLMAPNVSKKSNSKVFLQKKL